MLDILINLEQFPLFTQIKLNMCISCVEKFIQDLSKKRFFIVYIFKIGINHYLALF